MMRYFKLGLAAVIVAIMALGVFYRSTDQPNPAGREERPAFADSQKARRRSEEGKSLSKPEHYNPSDASKLKRGGSAVSSETFNLIVTVLDRRSRQPVAKAQVSLFHPGDSERSSDEERTDVNGTAVFDLEPGEWQLAASHEDYVSAEGPQVSVSAAVLEVTLWLDGGALVTGIVTNPNGIRISGAVVEFQGRSDTVVSTDMQGRFRTLLAPGNYSVLATYQDSLSSEPESLLVSIGAEVDLEIVLRPLP